MEKQRMFRRAVLTLLVGGLIGQAVRSSLANGIEIKMIW